MSGLMLADEDPDTKPLIRIVRDCYSQDGFDESFGYVPDNRSVVTRFKARIRPAKVCKCDARSWQLRLSKVFPILNWLPKYNIRRDLLADVIAGLTVGIMHIPQGMAYASLAGLPPVYGLYTSFFPSLIYVFLGTSGHISLGTFAVASLMVGSVRYQYVPDVPHDESDAVTQAFLDNATTMSSISNDSLFAADPSSDLGTTFPTVGSEFPYTPIQVVTTLTFATGLVQLAMGIFRLGFLSVYLSDQVVSGFTTGAAVMVFTAQLDKCFGVKIKAYSGVGKLYFIYKELALALPRTNVPTLIVSIICIISIYIVKEFINPKVKKKIRMPLPIDLFVIVIATSVSYCYDFHERFNMRIVDHIPTGLPAPELPKFELLPGLMSEALPLAIVVFSISVSMGKIFAKRHNYKIDPNQVPLQCQLMSCAT